MSDVERIPVGLGVNVVESPGGAGIAITWVVGGAQMTFITDPESADMLPNMLRELLDKQLPTARARKAGLFLPGQGTNGHQPMGQ